MLKKDWSNEKDKNSSNFLEITDSTKKQFHKIIMGDFMS